MKKTSFKKFLSVILSFVLIAVVALVMTGCGKEKTTTPTDNGKTSVVTPDNAEVTDADGNIVLGEGEKTLLFSVTDADGTITQFKILTDENTVGDALIKEGLISGENGDYGMYVKVVNGKTLDYDTDKMYWAFYADNEYAMTGVELTPIESGVVYEFRAEK